MTGSNTLAIDSMYYYTEIPFAAIHGMQTRPRDECELFEGYISEIDMHCQKGNTLSSGTDGGHIDLSVHTTTSASFTKPLFIATIANSVSQFLVGYNIAVLNTTEKYIFPGHSTMQWSWAVSALAIGAPLGALIGGHISDSYGRKPALVFNSIGFLAGGILQALSVNLQVLTLARFLLGLMSGVATVLVPIYLGELAPPHMRGMLGTVNHFALVVGILMADLLSFPLADDDGWRYLLGVTAAIALFQILLLPFVVESPRFLLHRNTRDSTASDILQRLRGYTSSEDVEEEVDTYIAVNTALYTPTPRMARKFDMENPPTSIMKKSSVDESNTDSILWEMMTIPRVRFLFGCSIVLHIGQQLCGVAAVFYYSTSLFEEILNKPLLGTTSIGAINVMFTYVALRLMDSCRRKSLALWSIGGMTLSCIGLILAQIGVINDIRGIPTVMLVNCFVAFYAIGLGPIPFLWIAEMVEPRYVALTMSICSGVNWTTNWLVGLIFPLMKESLGDLTFVPFAVVLVTLFLFVWVVLPEKRRPVAEKGRIQQVVPV
ncbi:MAG: hypothetical protein SGILL_000645 [Bacillariaceae sp.]